MANGPGLYSGIGKKTRDFLYADFPSDSPDDSLQRNGDETRIDVDLNNKIISSTLALDSDLFGPRHKYIIRSDFPDQGSSEFELQYKNDYMGISSCFGILENENINLSGVFGTNQQALGAEVSYDSDTRTFNWNAGLNSRSADGRMNFALTLNNKGDELKASYYNLINPANKLAFGAEVSRSRSTKVRTFTLGLQQSLGPMTSMKMRVNNHGKGDLLIQHECDLNSLFPKAFDKLASVGLTMVL